MNLREIKKSVRRLNLKQLDRLDTWLHELIEALKKRAGEDDIEMGVRPKSRETYRLERVRCGKEKCKCASGELHGPYWYAYWSEGGRTRSQYVGKKLRAKKKKR